MVSENLLFFSCEFNLREYSLFSFFLIFQKWKSLRMKDYFIISENIQRYFLQIPKFSPGMYDMDFLSQYRK